VKKTILILGIIILSIGISIIPNYNAYMCFCKYNEKSLLFDDSDLKCWGELKWTDIEPGETVFGRFDKRNVGKTSDLYWEITEWPEWGIWDFGSFFPKIPPAGLWIVFLYMTAPNQGNKTFTGQIKVININNQSDFCIINVSLTTLKKINYSFTNLVLINKELIPVLLIKKFNLFLT
jgi:hypothetical protein